MVEQRNWAGNYTYSTSNWHFPEKIDQVQQLVANSKHLKVVGSRHSFNGIADSSHMMISLQHLSKILQLDHERKLVTVEAGVKYSDLCLYLAHEGYALKNLASLPHISVAGACATATHGSGNDNSCLATAVYEMDVITADGDLVSFSRERNHEEFNGVVVNLGGLGVVTRLSLEIVPAFEIQQFVYENLPLIKYKEHFNDIYSSAYSVSSFTDWRNETMNQVWLKHYVTDDQPIKMEPTFFGAPLATKNLHPVGLGAENCTEQQGVSGPWYDRLPHFRMGFTPSAGEELQSEYMVPRERGYEALCALNEIRNQIAPALLISEIRTIAKDDLWMSPFYKQDSVGFHFTWQRDWALVRTILPIIEKQLAPFNPRPHWGKLFTMPPKDVQSRYEKLNDFQQLLHHYDPKGKFRNSFIESYLL
ncbi:FAD-binding protein [Litchfieldia alkalitelluris]|uniref:FAD-binding protein n=1 Tax=Litchfieldia alkalitelluris TaxID=304268 RepID=UPI00099649CA|nr:FAD-binding protein [Litchfieldia alkalitelluris]